MTLHRLERLEIIEFVVTETDRETQGDFEEDMLRVTLDEANDIELFEYAEFYGWA